MNTQEAIGEFGLEVVERLLAAQVEMTGRVVEGFVEFAAFDGDVEMRLLVGQDEFDAADELDQIDWLGALATAEFYHC